MYCDKTLLITFQPRPQKWEGLEKRPTAQEYTDVLHKIGTQAISKVVHDHLKLTFGFSVEATDLSTNWAVYKTFLANVGSKESKNLPVVLFIHVTPSRREPSEPDPQGM